jgi:hypothetical protein
MTTSKYNEENIRLAAYYNWKNAGCPSGQDEYFWNQAINQLYGNCKSSSCGCTKTTTRKTTSANTASSSKAASASKTKKSSSK